MAYLGASLLNSYIGAYILEKLLQLLNCLTVGGRDLVQELGRVLVPANVSVVIAKGNVIKA